MSYSDPTKLFNVLKERAKSSSSSGSFGNSNLLKFKQNTAYSFRLLWLPSEVREYPMINQYVHRIWDNNAVGSKDVHVICPTSQYDQDGNGFGTCPICSRMSELYKESTENGSKSAGELYSKFKRTLRGYVPVYVVNGPEEDIGKVKIMPYTISFKRFFDEKIFGIKSNAKNKADGQPNIGSDDDECIGIDAFMYYDPKRDEVITKGYNFIVSVNVKKIPINGNPTNVNDYSLDFSRKQTTIDDFDGVEITPEYFKNLSKEIHFDEDFYKMSDMSALNNFKMKYIDGVDDVEVEERPAPVVESKTKIEEDEEPTPKKAVKKPVADDDDTPFDEDEPPKPAKKAAAKKEEPEEKNEDASDEDIDIDALLADIK